FFFQAEDGIRDKLVTGVQTCALPIYARLLVETCIDVQPGWQVLVGANVLGRPLFDEVCKVIAERGAHTVPRLSFAGFGPPHPWRSEERRVGKEWRYRGEAGGWKKNEG